MNQSFWNLDANAFDVDNQVKWTIGNQDRVLPPIILFGYFPHRTDIPDTWRPRFFSIKLPLRIAFKRIFKTGNKEPLLPFQTAYQCLQPEPIQSAAETLDCLARWLSEQEFRACLWLHEIRLFRKGRETRFSMSGACHVGWTPPEVESPLMRPPFPDLMDGYTRGVGIVEPIYPKPIFKPWGMHINIQVGFRIDRLLERMGHYLLFGKGVPLMWMTLDLEVHSSGNHRVTFNGTYIPSQVYQADATLEHYDMTHDIGGYHQVKRTLGVGFSQPAPARENPVIKEIP